MFSHRFIFRAFVFGFFVALSAFLLGCSSSSNIENYPKDISSLKEKFPRLSAFPDSVREDASHPHFFYNKGFAQGGVILRLSYKLPSQEISDALKTLVLNYTESTSKEVNRYLFSHFPIEPYEPDQIIPNDFRVFLVETDLAEIKRSPNHSQLCAIAISERRKTIAYLFDSL